MDDTIRELHPGAIREETLMADYYWFVEHPQAQGRRRPYVPGERYPHPDLPGISHVLVAPITDDCRWRREFLYTADTLDDLAPGEQGVSITTTDDDECVLNVTRVDPLPVVKRGDDG